MTRPKMTSERSECGIPENKVGDKTLYEDNDGQIKEATFVKETVVKDEDGKIIGVVKEWQ